MQLKCVNTYQQFWITIISNNISNLFLTFFGLGVVVQVCGCFRPHLHAAEGSAIPSSSPSPLQVIHVIPICVQIVPVLCSLHSSSVRDVCECERLCVNHGLPMLPEATVHMCVPPTVWSHSRQ